MKKLLPPFFLAFFFFSASSVHAQSRDFSLINNATYTVDSSGNTDVVQKITIENKTDFFYSPTYSIVIGFESISKIRAYDTASAPIPIDVKTNDGDTEVMLTFRDRVVGKGKKTEFYFAFQTTDIARKNGSIWEVDIPGITNMKDFTVYDIQVEIPKEFGSPSIIKPAITLSGPIFKFNKEQVGESGVLLIFGDKQYYSFDLFYSISNPNLFPIKTSVALPSDTSYQSIILSSLEPSPETIEADEDGNWLAHYALKPQQKLDIRAKGMAQVNSTPQASTLSSEYEKKLLKDSQYWQTKDPQIHNLAQKLKTPDAIYDYVVKTLSYNYDKVLDQNKRLGASSVLKNPTNAVCLEFTDLFIALARSAGIPARAVEGYAHTQNSKLRPLSLVKDILHAWPEYYDKKRGMWIMVDPTWNNTTNGVDYFNSFDYDHFAFIRKGVDSSSPISPGSYKDDPNTKDVQIGFVDKNQFIPKSTFVVSDNFPSFLATGLPLKGSVTIKNTGTSSLPPTSLLVKSSLGVSKTYNIDAIPPQGVRNVTVDLGQASFLTNRKALVTILFGTSSIDKEISIEILPKEIILSVIGGVLIALAIAASIITIKVRRISVQRQK